MILLADFATERRNQSHSDLALFSSPMTDEEEFAARNQLKWRREGDAWILLYRRRRMGRVVPDKDHAGIWRSVKVDGILDLSDAATVLVQR
jgi:hypothetical protein